MKGECPLHRPGSAKPKRRRARRSISRCVSDGLRRLDRTSGRPHRPATAIADELGVTSSDLYSLALWNAYVERRCWRRAR